MSSPYKMKYSGVPALMKKLVGNQDKLPQHLKQAILDAPAKKVGGDKGKKKKDDFRYESDMPGVTGTTYTKDTKETASDYTRGGKAAKVGQKTSDPSFEPGQKPTVTSTYRDRTGKKKSGTTGKIEVEIKKGSTRFTTDKKKSTSKSPAKSYGKSPMKKTGKTDTELKAQRGFTTGAGKGKRKVKTKTPTSIYVKKEKTASAIKPRGAKKENIKASTGKSPAKMKGVKALKKNK
jgi:hypothetical protein